jgi:simple sugar transport system ATP-binding protein
MPALVLEDVSLTYPGNVRAVSGVDLTLEPGEIHALVGENGAGKTTLARIAAGALLPATGTVRAGGRVGLVHQHAELVGPLRVWENVVLGREPRRGAFLDAAAARAEVRTLADGYGLPLDPDAIVERLPVGLAQRVELLRELSREPAVLILDEPTSVLASSEVDALFTTLRALARNGTAVLVVTHKLSEVLAYAENVTVMRAGRVTARRVIGAETRVEELVRAMVGGEVPPLAARATPAHVPALRVAKLRTGDGPHDLRAATFEVRTGEIVGIAGVEGNGQSALADAIAGIVAYDGTMELAGTLLRPGRPAARLRAGMRFIPQDRQSEGLILPWPLVDNAILGEQERPELQRRGLRDRAAAKRLAARIVERFDVRGSLDSPVALLSGGNQQKLVTGRALAQRPRFVLAYQPTRGIDIGAAALVHSRLIEARNASAAILLVSFDLDEILALSDRVFVFYRGTIVGSFARGAFDRTRMGALMAGAA